MIKLYVDWNVISRMKQGDHSELSLIVGNKSQFMVYFSTSHVTDILVSYTGSEQQSNLINDDLDYISRLTNDLCAYKVNDVIHFNYYDPKDLFKQQLDFKLFTSSDKLFDFWINSPETDPLVQVSLKTYLNLSMPPEIVEAFKNPISREFMQRMYPQLNENSTLGDLIDAGWKNMLDLTEKDEYNRLRNDLQESLGIKPNQLYESKEPYKEIEKRYKQLEKQAGAQMQNYNKSTDNSPKWFHEIANEYLRLDMHGYQQDNIRVDKGRKSTMRNTIDDSFHAAFASMGDFYITSDIRSLKKTNEVYNKFKINTKVFAPKDFINYYHEYLAYNQISQHLKIWLEVLKSDRYVLNEEEFGYSMTYYLNYFLFDYFNKAIVINWNNNQAPTIMLSKDKPTNNKTVNSLEVATLINKLNKIFSVEVTSLNANDVSFNNWKDIEWQLNDCTYTLTFLNGYVQLYLYTT